MQDVRVSLADIVPPLANISPAVAVQLAEQPLLPLSVAGDRQFFVSWRHGRLADERTLRRLLDGRLAESAAAPGAQKADWWRDSSEVRDTRTRPG